MVPNRIKLSDFLRETDKAFADHESEESIDYRFQVVRLGEKKKYRFAFINIDFRSLIG